ncbi:nickel-dependent lactate racemase [Candidatus Sumerlaeota bacterium]|nr:nickel-dependent lactate racemase [Candidatus Sumerlaeota bacterium]
MSASAETTVRLAYGRRGIEVAIPAGHRIHVLDYGEVEPLTDPTAATAHALEHPIGSPPLREIAQRRRDCCIVVSDRTRPVPNRAILPPILDVLAQAGLDDDRIAILIATGIHSPTEGPALEEILGPDLVGRLRVLNHVARDPASCVSVGRTPSGVEAVVNRFYVESDLKIVTGLIEPHLMAGYSGGRKGICPGIASYDTVKYFHGVEILGHPRAMAGCLEGNPVHEEALAVARLAGVDFLVNATLDPERRVTGVFAGDLDAAHLEGVRFLRRHGVATVPEPVDVVLTSSAGYPLDATFYQTNKGMLSGYPIVKPGGTVIVAAECEEGEGSPEFRDLIDRAESPEQIMSLISRPGFYQIDQWAIQETCKSLSKNEVYFVSENLDPERMRRLGVNLYRDPNQALRDALAKHGPSATLAVIPKGPYVETALASD